VDDYLLALLGRASQAVSSEFQATLRRNGIQIPVWRVLASLSGTPDDTVTGLAETCLIQQPTMTKLLSRMVRDGLVLRNPDSRDRRMVRIQMTPKGEAMVASLLVQARRHEANVLARLDGIEGETLKRVLRGLIERPNKRRRNG
jgi:DNA-binding MarR family transcriptional regulator